MPMTFDLRAKETLGALAQIGQYLSGIPGRKNLIWVSESFPISIAPDPDTGNNPFAGHPGITPIKSKSLRTPSRMPRWPYTRWMFAGSRRISHYRLPRI